MISRQRPALWAQGADNFASAGAQPRVVVRWSADHKRISCHILRYDGSGSNHCPLSDFDIGKDGAVGPDRRSIAYRGGSDLPVAIAKEAERPRDGTRTNIVRKDGMRSNEHPIPKLDAVIDAGVVLQLAIFPNNHVEVDEDALA